MISNRKILNPLFIYVLLSHLVLSVNDLCAKSRYQDSDSDKFIQQKYIQLPYQVYMSFLEIQITL